MNENIVEAQFFLWDRNVSVRFFDQEDRVTKLALKIDALTKRRADVLEAVDKAKGLWRKILCYRYDRLSRKIAWLSLFKRHRVAAQLGLALKGGKDIAVECTDRSFRLMRKDESKDLIDWVSSAHGIWLFLFKPNELLAQTNSPVATVW